MSGFSRRPTNGSSAGAAPLRRVPSALGMNRSHSSAAAPRASASNGVTSPTLPTRRDTTAIFTGSTKSLTGGAAAAATDADNNINVVVRIRGRSAREIAANDPLVAEVDGLRSPTVRLVNPSTTPTSSTSTANAAQSTTKTYDFGTRSAAGKSESVGNVFGPEADQVMIYHDVAKPILDQVMQGYNCTIFAYGQTGTGKTYTMEGDLALTNGISISPEAGIIPRTLYSLFAKLTEDQAEYSVKCTFVELYNEELRDLNALDYVDPDVAASADTSKSGGVKILDDRNTGVVVQGLEETMITSAEEGLKVLKRGSERRHVAATKCNDRSSRSHSIFTIMIHIKENSVRTGGEDMLKVGKLNLVDLAGSENVARSGATNERAREAGMINVSLSALGRVINKLVEKGPKNADKTQHVPYRDSKLTRLLRDSLGGRTKTTIIAAISPVNYDETISTLEYASKAKSIQNRPEVNQRMSKNLLLGHYATEIERLKQDLVSTREKNGIYFSQESWDVLSAEQDAARVGFAQSKRQLELCEARVDAIKDQYEMALRLVGTRESELRAAAKVLDEVRDEVKELLTILEEKTIELEGANLLGQATEVSRQGWRRTAQSAVDHAVRLHDKVDRKAKVEKSNLVVVTNGERALSSKAKGLAKELSTFSSRQAETVEHGKKRLLDTIERGRQATESTLAFVEERDALLDQRGQNALVLTGQFDKHGQLYLGAVEASREELAAALQKATQELEETNQQASELRQQVAALRVELSTVRTLATPLRSLQQELGPTLEADAQRLQATLEQDGRWNEAYSARIVQLREHETARLAEECVMHAQEADAVVAFLTGELSTVLSSAYVERFVGPLRTRLDEWSERHFTNRQASSSHVEEELKAVSVEAQKAAAGRAASLTPLMESNQLVTRQHADRAERAEMAAKKLEKELIKLSSSVASQVDSFAARARADTEAHLCAFRNADEQLEAASSTFRSGASTSRAQLEDEVSALADESRDSLANAAQAHVLTRDMYSAELEAAREDLKSLSTTASEYVASSSSTVAQLQQNIKSYLSTSYSHDMPTGATPVRRQWSTELVPQLEGTPSRVIDRLRQAQKEGLTFVDGESKDVVSAEALSEDEDDDVAALGEPDDDYRAPTPPSVNQNSLVLDHPPHSPIDAMPIKRIAMNPVGAAPLQVVEGSNLRTSRSRRKV